MNFLWLEAEFNNNINTPWRTTTFVNLNNRWKWSCNFHFSVYKSIWRKKKIIHFSLLLQFSENFDLGLFNPFDALSQDSLLTLDTRVEENLQNIQPLSPGLSQPVQQFNEKNSITFNSNCKNKPTFTMSISSDFVMEELDESFNGIVTDDELASLNIKDLNRKLKEKGLNKETIEKLKQRRRTLKNRKYATE